MQRAWIYPNWAESIVAYKLGNNYSIFKAHEFIICLVNRGRFRIDKFNVKTLYRVVKHWGKTGGRWR